MQSKAPYLEAGWSAGSDSQHVLCRSHSQHGYINAIWPMHLATRNCVVAPYNPIARQSDSLHLDFHPSTIHSACCDESAAVVGASLLVVCSVSRRIEPRYLHSRCCQATRASRRRPSVASTDKRPAPSSQASLPPDCDASAPQIRDSNEPITTSISGAITASDGAALRQLTGRAAHGWR